MNTIKFRPIYEVIDEAYIKDSKISPDDIIKECKIIQIKHNLYREK